MAKRTRRYKYGFRKWFKSLSTKKKISLCAGVVLLCLLIFVVVFVASKFSKLNMEEIPDEEIIINEKEEVNEGEELQGLGKGYTNFVLFGGDSRTGEVDRYINTDAIIVVSLNNETKEVKMVSVYRDTLLDIGTGKYRKCNSAYSTGGALTAINMLNQNLDLDIKRYVTVDFGVVVDVVDMIGGIEVDVSPAEVRATNEYIGETARVTGNKATYLKQSGLQTLNGVQATTYARIRKGVGDDYARTERQRLVIQKVAEKVMKSDLATLNKIIDHVLPSVATNMPASEIMKYASHFAQYKIGESTGFPYNKASGTVAGIGSSVYSINLADDVQQLHKFLFGIENYQPSKKVRNISDNISYLVYLSKQEAAQDDPETEDPDAGTDPGTTVDPGTGADPGTTVGPGTGTDPGTTVDPGTGTNPGTTVDPGTGTNPGTTVDPGTGTDPGTTVDPGTGTDAGTSSETATQ